MQMAGDNTDDTANCSHHNLEPSIGCRKLDWCSCLHRRNMVETGSDILRFRLAMRSMFAAESFHKFAQS